MARSLEVPASLWKQFSADEMVSGSVSTRPRMPPLYPKAVRMAKVSSQPYPILVIDHKYSDILQKWTNAGTGGVVSLFSPHPSSYPGPAIA